MAQPLNPGKVIAGLDVRSDDDVTVEGTDYVDNIEYSAYRYYDYDVTEAPAEKYYDISPYAWCGNNPVKFVDPDGRFFGEKYLKNLWDFYSGVYKSTSVSLSAGLQAGASVKISNKEVGAHVSLVSGELEVLKDGKFSVNNTSVTQGADRVFSVGVENEVRDNGNGTYTETSKKTEVIAEPSVTLNVNAQAIVGVEVKVDVGRIFQEFKKFVKNTFFSE